MLSRPDCPQVKREDEAGIDTRMCAIAYRHEQSGLLVTIHRNTPLPVTKRGRFKTHKNDQRSVAVQVIEGGDASGNNSMPIGKCIIRDLPPGLPAGTAVEVAFTYSENGRLNVKARVPDLNIEASLSIERASSLSDSALQEWDAKLRKPRLG